MTMKLNRTLSQLLTATAAVTLCSIVTTGCSKEEGIDFDDIDTTLGFELRDFKLPGNNSTHEIALEEVFDIDNSDVIDTDEQGNYVFVKAVDKDDITPARPCVDIVTVGIDQNFDKPVVVPELASLSDYVTLPQQPTEQQIEDAVDYVIDNIDNYLPEELKQPSDSLLNLFELSTTDEHIVQLLGITTSTEGTNSQISSTISFSPDLRKVFSRIDMLKVALPDYLVLEVSASQGNPTLSSDNVVTLTNISVKNDISLTLTIKGFNNINAHSEEEECFLVAKNGNIHLKGAIELDFLISRNAIDKNGLKEVLMDAISNDYAPQYQVLSTTHISPVVINGIKGEFAPDLQTGSGDFTINDLPDFLKDDEVRLVLDNPMLVLDISNNANIVPEVINPVIVAYKDNREIARTVLPTFSIDRHPTESNNASTISHIIIADRTDRIPAQYGSYTKYQPAQGRLSDLVNTIPDRIAFEYTAGVKAGTIGQIELGETYEIRPEFKFEAPLAFDAGTAIVYRDSVDGWKDDLKDLTLRKGATVKLTANVTNKVPLNLMVSAEGMKIDNSGNRGIFGSNDVKIDITTSAADNAIQAGTPENPVTTQLTIVATLQSQEAMRLLDGLRFKAQAYTPEGFDGNTLNKETQKLQISNIGITLNGIVEYDPDKD
ncbi:MAG: hypothetical protein IJT98_04225 [Prevotella sp.]|nr:hypothetical protein [Prevotella sp.]